MNEIWVCGIGKLTMTGENLLTQRQKPVPVPCVYHKSNMNFSGNELMPPRWKAGS